MNEILFTVGGVVSAIMAFFLQRIVKEHDKTKEIVIKLETKIALLENNHTHHNSEFEKLNKSIDKLTDKIDNLTKLLNAQ